MSSAAVRRGTLALTVAMMLAPAMAAAATKTDAEAAIAAARKAEAAAGVLQNQWLPTEAALKMAAKALAAGKYDAAVATAKRAHALAELSIQQAREQDKLWPNEVVR